MSQLNIIKKCWTLCPVCLWTLHSLQEKEAFLTWLEYIRQSSPLDCHWRKNRWQCYTTCSVVKLKLSLCKWYHRASLIIHDPKSCIASARGHSNRVGHFPPCNEKMWHLPCQNNQSKEWWRILINKRAGVNSIKIVLFIMIFALKLTKVCGHRACLIIHDSKSFIVSTPGNYNRVEDCRACKKKVLYRSLWYKQS